MIKINNKSILSVYDETTGIEKIMKGTLKVYEAWRKLIANGVPPITLTKCKNTNLVDYKIYGESIQSKLPSEYQQVEYIEATGTQYINSNFYPDSNSTIEMEFLMPTATFSANKNNFIFGVTNDATNTKRFATNVFLNINLDKLEVYPRYSTNAPSAGVTFINFDEWHNIRIDKGSYYLDNELLASYSETFEKNEYPLYINAYNSYGTVTSVYIGYTKIRRCKLWDNGVLVRDMMPCYRKSDNEIGMYDLVNNIFYTNVGTGTFLKGNDAPTPETPIEIESVGDKTNNIYSANNGFYNSRIISLDAIKVKPNTDYILSVDNYTITEPLFAIKGLTEYVENMTPEQSWNAGTQIKGNVKSFNSGNYEYIIIRTWQTNDVYGIDENVKIQLEEGTIATEFEPYGYKIPVTVRGKNYLNIEHLGNINNWDTSSTYGFYEISLPNGNYIYNFETDLTSYKNNILILNKVEATSTNPVKTLINGYAQVESKQGKFTISNNEKIYLNWYAPTKNQSSLTNLINDILNNFIIEEGDTFTGYEPYVEPTTTNIYLKKPLRKIGDYADYIDFENGKVVRNIIEKDVTVGSLYADRTDVYVVWIMHVATDANVSNIYNTPALCDKFTNFDGGKLSTINVEGFSVRNKGLYVAVSKDRVSDSSSAIQYVKDLGAKVYYQLAEKTPEDITLPDIPTHKGTNIIEVDTKIPSSYMEVAYYGKGKLEKLEETENIVLNDILGSDTETELDITDTEINQILDEIIGG